MRTHHHTVGQCSDTNAATASKFCGGRLGFVLDVSCKAMPITTFRLESLLLYGCIAYMPIGGGGAGPRIPPQAKSGFFWPLPPPSPPQANVLGTPPRGGKTNPPPGKKLGLPP